MSRIEKLIAKLQSNPKDFTYSDLVSLLRHFGYVESKRGKTAGSRRAFIHTTTFHIIRLHKPHPTNTLKIYQVKEVIEELTKNGFL